eukprot:gene860-1072_t
MSVIIESNNIYDSGGGRDYGILSGNNNTTPTIIEFLPTTSITTTEIDQLINNNNNDQHEDEDEIKLPDSSAPTLKRVKSSLEITQGYGFEEVEISMDEETTTTDTDGDSNISHFPNFLTRQINIANNQRIYNNHIKNNYLSEITNVQYSFNDIKSCNCVTPYFKLIASNAAYRLLWLSSLISLMGDWVNELACLTILAKYNASGIMVSAFLVVRESPPFLFSPFTGVVSDTFDRRHIMMVTDVIRVFLVLFFLFVRSESHLWLLYVLAFLQFSVSSFFMPAKSALMPSVVDPSDLVTANAVEQTTYSSMMLIGASLGGVITYQFGTTVNFIVDSFSYIGSALCVFFLYRLTKNIISTKSSSENQDIELSINNNANNNDSILTSSTTTTTTTTTNNNDKVSLLSKKNVSIISSNQEEDEETGTELLNPRINLSGALDKSESIPNNNSKPKSNRTFSQVLKDNFMMYIDGFRFLRENPYILIITLTKASGALVWTASDIMNIRIADSTFKLGEDGSLSLGIILSAGGLGVLLVPLIFSRIIKDCPENHNNILKFAFFLNAIFTASLGFTSHNFPVYLIFNTLRSAATSILWLYSSSILQQLVPDEVRGRVFAFEYGVLTVASITTKFLVGVLLDETGLTFKQLFFMFGTLGIFIFFAWIIVLGKYKRKK